MLLLKLGVGWSRVRRLEKASTEIFGVEKFRSYSLKNSQFSDQKKILK